MSGFVFKLDSFLKVKEKLEEKSKVEYGKAISKLEYEKNLLQKLINNKQQSIEKFKISIGKGVNPNFIKNINDFIKSNNNKIENQLKKVEEAVTFSEQKREELIITMKDKKVFETLKEKEKEAYLKEIIKKEQKIVDEVVSYKYSKKV